MYNIVVIVVLACTFAQAVIRTGYQLSDSVNNSLLFAVPVGQKDHVKDNIQQRILEIDAQIAQLLIEKSELMNRTFVIYEIQARENHVAKRSLFSGLRTFVQGVKAFVVKHGILTKFKTSCRDFLRFTGNVIISELYDHVSKRFRRSRVIGDSEIQITHEDLLAGQKSETLCGRDQNSVTGSFKKPKDGYINVFSSEVYDGTTRDINSELHVYSPVGLRNYYQRVLNKQDNCTIFQCLCHVVEAAKIVATNSSFSCCEQKATVTVELIVTTFLVHDAQGVNS